MSSTLETPEVAMSYEDSLEMFEGQIKMVEGQLRLAHAINPDTSTWQLEDQLCKLKTARKDLKVNHGKIVVWLGCGHGFNIPGKGTSGSKTKETTAKKKTTSKKRKRRKGGKRRVNNVDLLAPFKAVGEFIVGIFEGNGPKCYNF